MQTINRVGRDTQCSGESETCVGVRDVVVNGLGQVNDIQTCFGQPVRILRSSATADEHDTVQFVLLAVRQDRVRHVNGFAIDVHLVRLVARSSKDRAADGQDPGEEA